MLINKRGGAVIKYFNDCEAFIEYSNDMDGIYKDIEKYKPNKKRKILITFDDMIGDILSIKKLNPLVIELFIRVERINISLIFTTQSSFAVPKNVFKKCSERPYSFLVIYTTFASDNFHVSETIF